MVNPRANNRTDAILVRTRFQRPTSALRLRRDVRVEFERARAGRVEEAARQTSVTVERVRRARFVARRPADVLVCDLFAARRANEGDAKERGLLGRIQHVAAREDVILRQRRDLAAVLIPGAEGWSHDLCRNESEFPHAIEATSSP